jgi:hypothetical protein
MDYYQVVTMYFVMIVLNNGELKQYRKIKGKCFADVQFAILNHLCLLNLKIMFLEKKKGKNFMN